MNASGEPDLPALTRRALLDALDALSEHRQAVVIIGAQAVFLRTGGMAVALPDMTKDSDLALDPRHLKDHPSKLHKLAEREDQPDRLADKDAHDVYRLLSGVPLAEMAAGFSRLLADPVSRNVTESALASLERLFARGATATGSMMAGRAETGVGAPDVVSAAVAALAGDVLDALERR